MPCCGMSGYNWNVSTRPCGPITGSTKLPVGFAHPHASDEARKIAEDGMILRVQVGSGVHGTSITGQDDRDELGVCLEPSQFVTGLARVPNGVRGVGPSVAFEQYERHTAWDRPGGVANRSGAGDLDVIIYSARKWARLALAGNPTVLLVLFVPDEEVVFRNDTGAELVSNAHRFVSRLAADRFLGYLQGQKAAMTGQAGAHTNRPELVAVHGYDTKYAMHALRLGCRASSCSPPGASRCPFRSRIAGTCDRFAAGNGRSPRSSKRSPPPRRGSPSCATALPFPISRIADGWTTGCTAATGASGPCPAEVRSPAVVACSPGSSGRSPG